MRRRSRGRSAPESQMNVVPYIDVMLVLLIIFMVTAPMFTPSVINIPSVGQANHVENVPAQVVVRDSDNYLIKYDNKEQSAVSLDDLASKLTLMIDLAVTPVVVVADKQITYDKVITVVDKLYSSDIKNVSLAVKQSNG